MKRKGFAWIEFAVGVGVLALIAAVFLPVFARSRENAKKSSCTNNLKQVGIGLSQYTQDYDERLPRVVGTSKPTNQKPYGWADALFPYTKSRQIYQCPNEAQNGSDALPTALGYTDYWFNSRLAALELKYTNNPALTVAMGEGNDGSDLTDARYNLPALPATWLTNRNSPTYRHKDRANYAFLDGHVKALSPDQITNEPLVNGKPTFAVR